MPILMNHLTVHWELISKNVYIDMYSSPILPFTERTWESKASVIFGLKPSLISSGVRGAQNMSPNIANIQGAEHAVIFSISCAAPFQTFLLSYLLLRFVMENILLDDINFFEILGLAFRYHEHGVLGVMIFGSAFTLAVNHRRSQAKNGTDEEYFYVKKTLCSRWIRPETTWADRGPLEEAEVVKLMKNGR